MTAPAGPRAGGESRPAKVAIVGGGCGAMAAAFELTRPEHRGRFEVTVYQLGWRLGGKGASGRGPGDRIEEHGLHVWLGFYENAFRLMRECYDELARDPATCRIARWSDAFFRDSLVGVAERDGAEAWKTWTASFPPGEGEPGDPLTQNSPFTIASYMRRTVELIRTLVFSAAGLGAGNPPEGECAKGPTGAALPLSQGLEQLVKLGGMASAAGVIEGLRVLETLVGALGSGPQESVGRLLDTVASGVRDVFEAAIARDDGMRRQWEIADVTLAILRGCIRFRLATDPRGFDAIDDHDVRDWLVMNGASARSVDSALVRGLYDLALAYPRGDASRPAIAAGQGIRGALRMFFTYRGALFWKMRAGMGDIVFAPFYETLERRGVRFEFFHRLRDIRVSGPGDCGSGEQPHVEAIEFDVQAQVRDGGPYRPLVDVRGLPCWPAEPDWSQLVDGDCLAADGRNFESHWDGRRAGTRTLRVVDDFDFVVLGVGGGAVPHVAQDLVANSDIWRRGVAHLNTVATQAFQVWLREDVSELGWTRGPANVSAFAKPFDTWADMSHLTSEESFPVAPGAIAYFCGVLPDPPWPPAADDAEFPAEQAREVRERAVRFLNEDVRHLWPNAQSPPGRFRWELLVAPDEKPGEEPPEADESRFDTQYWRANVNPSDRYVLALPGTLKHRISPLDAGFDNLTVAGDWTDAGFNEGCVEAAVMSGRLAAHALSGRPKLSEIIGYDHP